MKKISIFIQLVLIMFVIAALPTILVIYANSIQTRKKTEQAIAESALNKIRANKVLGDEMITNIIYDALDLILAKQYADLNGITSYETLNSDYKYVNVAIKMKSKLDDLAARNKLVYSIFYYMDNADYVISTDGGFVKLERYDDVDWLNDAVPKIQGAEGVWYPRKLVTSRSGQEVVVDLVSYCYRSSSLYTSAKGTVVINVYEKELSNLIYSDLESEGGEGFLIDEKGNVITHSNSKLLYKNISDFEHINQIISSKGSGGYGITRNQEVLYTYEKSGLYGWIYVNAYSLEQIYAQSKQIIKSGLGMTLLIILAGAICAVLISLQISKPIRKLADEVKGLNPLGDEDKQTKNEIAYLSGAFGQIKEREKVLQNTLSQSEASIRKVGINNLIHGEGLQEKESNLLEIYFPYSHFIVCILSIDSFYDYQHATTHDLRKNHRLMLYEKIRLSFPDEYILDSIRYNVSSISILLNMKDYDSDQVKDEIRKSLVKVQESFFEAVGQTLTVGVSQVHNHFKDIKICGYEALEALKKRLVLGHGKIIFYKRNDKNGVSSYATYHHEKRIMNYLEIGELEKIEEELSAMVDSIRAIPDISVENIMLVFNQLTGSILIYLNTHNYSVSAVLGGEKSNLYLALTELETMDEIKEFLKIIYLKIIDYQNADLLEETPDYTKAILRFIKQNYKTDIDFEQLSNEIGISYSYARKIIKVNTGKSLIDNLNQVRIDKAKTLLEQSDMTINDISAAVGYNSVQSLYRFFKKYEGISPSDYKFTISNHKEQK